MRSARQQTAVGDQLGSAAVGRARGARSLAPGRPSCVRRGGAPASSASGPSWPGRRASSLHHRRHRRRCRRRSSRPPRRRSSPCAWRLTAGAPKRDFARAIGSVGGCQTPTATRRTLRGRTGALFCGRLDARLGVALVGAGRQRRRVVVELRGGFALKLRQQRLFDVASSSVDRRSVDRRGVDRRSVDRRSSARRCSAGRRRAREKVGQRRRLQLARHVED